MAVQSPLREDITIESSDKKIDVEFNAEKERLNLAKWVLLGLFIVILSTFYLYAYRSNEQSKEIFDFCKIAVPPIVTLILGAYFKSSRD